MTKEKDTPQKTSRRSFVQTVATALVAAPLVASHAQLATEAEAALNNARVTHGPPIIIDDGSLHIELPEDSSGDADAGAADPRRHKLYLANALRELHSLSVYADGRNGVVEVFKESGMEAGATLSLWMQVQDAGGSYPPIAATAQPNLKILGKGPRTAALIETDQKVKNKFRKTNKKYRPFKYEHPGFGGSNEYFRIGKWELRRYDGSVEGTELGPTSLYESFRFFITFTHA